MIQGRKTGELATGSLAAKVHGCVWSVKVSFHSPVAQIAEKVNPGSDRKASMPKSSYNGHMNIRTASQSKGRRWSDGSHFLFHHVDG